jgi:hypothetical protein
MPFDQVISKFIQNKIDGYCLLTLTKEELEEIIKEN